MFFLRYSNYVTLFAELFNLFCSTLVDYLLVDLLFMMSFNILDLKKLKLSYNFYRKSIR